MKKILIGLLLMPLMVLSDEIKIGDVTWSFTVVNDKATVTGADPSLGAIEIPSTLNGYLVRSVGDYAFADCSGLTSVTIPEGVTNIGYYAFCYCSGLTTVTIPEGVTSIGDYAFSGCSGLTSFLVASGNPSYASIDGLLCTKDGKTVIAGINGEVVIPPSVTSIGDRAFYNCRGLTSITVPSSVTNIGSGAFSGCIGLTEVTIPSSVTNIGYSAFYNCSGLTSVTILEGVTSIGEDAFAGCSGLTWVAIPSSVTSIGYSAFADCSGLTSVTIPACVTSLSNTFPSAYKKIQKVVIYKGVMNIGEDMFSGCSGLTWVAIPSSVTSIGYSAFADCSGLTSVTIPEGVTSIGYSAFEGCSGLTSVTIPSSVTSIGDCAFLGCSGLADEDGFVIVEGVLYGYYGTATSVTIPSGVTSFGGYAFNGCNGLMSVVIPEGVTSIGDRAFSGCSGLTSVTIPSSVTSIGYSAFAGCDGLTTVICLSRDVDRIKSLLRDSLGATHVEKLNFCLLAPVFIPPSGMVIDEALKISITCAVENATIHYTMDGSDPTTNSPLFKKFMLSEKTEIRAIAECWGIVSDVEVAVYAKGWCETPVISSDEGAFHFSGKEVRITCASEGAEIRYTVDGTNPTAQSPLYEGPFTIDNTTTVRAIAVGHPDYFDSEVASATFKREWLKVAAPVLSVNGSVSFIGGKFVISVTRDVMHESVLRYTLDGSNPTESSPILEGDSIVMTDSATVKVRAFIDDWRPSDVAVADVVKIWTIGDTLNQPDKAFPTGTDHPWVADRDFTHDGKESARSGVVSHGECSWIQTIVDRDATVKFWWKVSSEEDWDELSVLTNGVVVAKISGERDWAEVSLSVSAGTVLRWEYNKDESISEGSDCGWIDEISLTIAPSGDDPEPVVVYRTVTFDGNGGAASVAGRAVENGSAVGELPTATRAGYVFLGWFTAASDGMQVTAATVVTADVTCYAQWNAAYTYYDNGDGTIALTGVKDESNSLVIPSSIDDKRVTSIGDCAFVGCSGLMSLVIPEGVTNIGNFAFWGCSGLTSVTIPSSVTSIGGWTFIDCSGLKTVYVEKGDVERVKGLCGWPSGVEFVEISLPTVEGDSGATVTGDAETGFVIKPSEGKTAVEVVIPQGVDAAKVTVEVSPKVESVKLNGAKVKIVSGSAEITEFLDIPGTTRGDDGGVVATQLDGVIDLTKATVKEEIVKEVMDPEKGAKIELNAANPSLTTPNTRIGLFYQLREGTTLGGMAEGDSTVGNGQPWTPEIKVKGGNSAFYSIGVGKGE